MATNDTDTKSISMSDTFAELQSLPSYKIQLLNADVEIDILEENISLLKQDHRFEIARDVCVASQTVLYALDDLKFTNGADDPIYRSKLQFAAHLLKSVAEHRELTLKTVSLDQAREVEIYFENVSRRYDELVRRQQL